MLGFMHVCVDICVYVSMLEFVCVDACAHVCM